MKIAALFALPAAAAISCNVGTTYTSGCGSTLIDSSTTVQTDCGDGYDQCYAWTYDYSSVVAGCTYATLGCDSSASSWGGESYASSGDYTAECCTSDNCNEATGGAGSSNAHAAGLAVAVGAA